MRCSFCTTLRCGLPDYQSADDAIAHAMTERVSASVPVIHVWNKTDCGDVATDASGVRVSARTGTGLEDLRQALLAVAGWQSSAEGVYIARARHVHALQAVQAHLETAAQQLDSPGPALDLLAEELRLAQNALSEITGEFSSDDLLGVIFSSFCIGK